MKKLFLLILYFALNCIPACCAEVQGILLDFQPRQHSIKILEREGQAFSYALARDYRIFASSGDKLPAYALLPGDQLSLQFDDRLRVKTLTAGFKAVSGQIIFCNQEKLVLESGEIYALAPEVLVTLNGRKAGIPALKAKSGAVLRINPVNFRAYVVESRGKTGSPASTRPGIMACDFTVEKPLRRDGVIRFKLRGIPGARSWVDIAGAAQGVPLTETAPGSYQGIFRVYEGLDLRETYISAGLSWKQELYRYCCQTPVSIAFSPPEIVNPYPAPDQRISSEKLMVVSAGLLSAGSLIAPDKTGFWLDGIKLDRGLERMAQAAMYFPPEPLPPGRHTVTLKVYDKLGNCGTRSWSFMVEKSTQNRD